MSRPPVGGDRGESRQLDLRWVADAKAMDVPLADSKCHLPLGQVAYFEKRLARRNDGTDDLLKLVRNYDASSGRGEDLSRDVAALRGEKALQTPNLGVLLLDFEKVQFRRGSLIFGSGKTCQCGSVIRSSGVESRVHARSGGANEAIGISAVDAEFNHPPTQHGSDAKHASLRLCHSGHSTSRLQGTGVREPGCLNTRPRELRRGVSRRARCSRGVETSEDFPCAHRVASGDGEGH